MRSAALLTLLLTFRPGAAAARPPEASTLPRAYFRAATPDARLRIAPFVDRELQGGVVCATIPPAMLANFAASPGLTFLGYEAIYYQAPIAMEEAIAAAARPPAVVDSARTCSIPHYIPHVGWGIKAMYEDPNLVKPSGGAGVRVAVIDGGVAPHLDLVRRLAKCVDLTPDSQQPPCSDSTNHGTLVASVIAADGGADGLGMYGMAPEASIYSYRVCEPDGACPGAYIAAAIYAAIADGVNIINMSLTGSGNDDQVRAAIDAAVGHNILVVAAAGNRPPYSRIGYPAVYPEVMSVGAIKDDLTPWPYTAPGFNDGDYVRQEREIDVGAPGVGVLSAMKNGCWVLGTGTSLAVPHIVGLAAKLWSGNGFTTRARLQVSARFHDIVPAGDDTLTGFGLPTVREHPDLFVIGVTPGPGTTMSPAGAVIVTPGATQTITISPADDCHVIQNVVVDGGSLGAISSYTFTNVRADHAIQASSYTLGPYAITSSAGHGGAISPAGRTIVACGNSQTYSIGALPGCGSILDVKVDGVWQGPLPSFTFHDVRGDHTIEAEFSAPTFTIHAGASGGGSVIPSGDVFVDCSASQTFNILPSSCHPIQQVLVDGVPRGPSHSYTFNNVTSDHTLYVNFFPAYQVTLTALPGPGGTITPGGAIRVECGSDQGYAIAADECHFIQGVKVDGVGQGAISTYWFHGVTAGHAIEATFGAPGPYTLTATAPPEISIRPDGASSVGCGSSIEYTIAPVDSCRPIGDVRVDGGSVGAVSHYRFTDVRRSHTITASAAPGLTIDVTHTDVNDMFDGTIDLSVSGGTPPYSYEWSNGSSSQDLTNLPGGIYRVRVRDAKGCSQDLTVTITSDAPAVAVLRRPAPNPSRGAVRVRYGIPADAVARLSVLDLQGREIAVLADGVRRPGWAWADWDGGTRGGQAPGGIYFIRLKAGGRQIVQRLALIR